MLQWFYVAAFTGYIYWGGSWWGTNQPTNNAFLEEHQFLVVDRFEYVREIFHFYCHMSSFAKNVYSQNGFRCYTKFLPVFDEVPVIAT